MHSYNDARRYSMQNMGARTPMQPGGQGSWTAIQPARKGPEQKKPRRVLPFILLVGALIIATVLVTSDYQRANSALAVQVGDQQAVPIDLNQSLPISPYLLGSNVFPKAGTSSQDQAKSGFMSYDQQVVQGLRSSNVKLLRFPGGNWGEEHTLSTEQLNAFSDLLNQVGAEGFMQAQLSDPNDITPVPLETRASRAALLVDYMNNQQSIQRTGANAKAPFHPIKYWSIGNEPDLLTNPETNRKFTVAEYTQAFIAFSLAMHQKDPNIKIFGPEISQYMGAKGPKDTTGKQWMEDFLRGINSYERTHALSFRLLDGVSFHRYPFDDANKDSNKLLSNPAEWDSTLPALRQFIRQQFGQDLPIAITEINTNPGKNVPPQELAALWWGETLGKLMSNQVEYVAFFSTEGVATPYPFFTRDLKETALLRTTQLFAQLQNNLIPVQGAQGPVSIYATQDSGHKTVSLLLINKTNESQHISVRPDSLLPLNTTWSSSNMTIPGYSMAVLTLHRNNSNEAFSFSNKENAQQAAPGVQHVNCGSNTDSASVC